MKFEIRILFLLAIIVFNSCSSNKLLTYENDITLKNIKKKFAPDKRVVLFDVYGNKKGDQIVYFGETNDANAKDKLIQRSEEIYGKVIDSIKLLPSSNLGEYTKGVVNISACNIRSKPKHSSELSTQAILGTPVTILKKKNSWFYIQTPDNYLGWVDAGGISLLDLHEQKQWFEADKIIFKEVFGFVYSKPDIKSNTVSDIVAGSILKLLKNLGDVEFWKVSFPDGRVGYLEKKSSVKLNDFIKDNLKFSGEDVIATSKELMGIPYLWGGTSAKSLDCSGFTKTVYFMHGVVLARDASQQVYQGEKIEIDREFSKLKKGDLLFFGNIRDDGSERITHVAIYLGNFKIIHATGQVKIQSLRRGDPDFVEYRLNSLLQVRRIIGNEGRFKVERLKNVKAYWNK